MSSTKQNVNGVFNKGGESPKLFAKSSRNHKLFGKGSIMSRELGRESNNLSNFGKGATSAGNIGAAVGVISGQPEIVAGSMGLSALGHLASGVGALTKQKSNALEKMHAVGNVASHIKYA